MALPGWTGRFAKQRRLIQLGFLVVFALLPLFDLFRFDFTISRFYFFRKRDLAGRVDAHLARPHVRDVARRGRVADPRARLLRVRVPPDGLLRVRARPRRARAEGRPRRFLRMEEGPRCAPCRSRCWRPSSVLFSLLFMAYFAPLPEVVRRLARLDVGPWVGSPRSPSRPSSSSSTSRSCARASAGPSARTASCRASSRTAGASTSRSTRRRARASSATSARRSARWRSTFATARTRSSARAAATASTPAT